MKIVFWALLCANVLLFAIGRGLLGNMNDEVHEPARLRNQLAPQRLVLLSGTEAQAAAGNAPAGTEAPGRQLVATEPAPAAPALAPAPPRAEPPAAPPAPAAAATAPATATPALAGTPVACVETDAFTAADARRFESRVAELGLGTRQTRLAVPFQEVNSYMVYLPSQGSKEEADRRVAELQEQGVTSFFVIRDDTPMKFAISLGVFKSEAAARTEQENLAKKGVQNARILPRGPQSQRFTFRFRNIDTEIRGRIVEAGRGMAASVLHNCK